MKFKDVFVFFSLHQNNCGVSVGLPGQGTCCKNVSFYKNINRTVHMYAQLQI